MRELDGAVMPNPSLHPSRNSGLVNSNVRAHKHVQKRYQDFFSVWSWDAIEDTPQEAENMKLRSALMTALKSHLAQINMSQAQAAQLFGVTQPRISDLMRGKINLFGLDALVNMASAAGLHVDMRIRQAA